MKKYIKTTIIVVVSLIAFLLVGVLGYGAYILISYNRIGDQTLEVTHNSTLETININEEYSCINIQLSICRNTINNNLQIPLIFIRRY